MEKFESALGDLDEAIRLFPEYSAAFNNRGVTRYNSGDLEGVIKDYGKAILIDPEDPEIYHNRGVAYRSLGNSAMAENDFSRAAKLGLDTERIRDGKSYESETE